MNKVSLLLCGLLLLMGCANNIDATPGEKCMPNWYKKKTSDNEIVYGYSRERSRSSSLASTIGLASAQAHALQQINVQIKNEAGKQTEEKLRDQYGDQAADYAEVLYERLKVQIDQPCIFCAVDKSVECEDSGYLVVFTRVKVDVEGYLNQDLRSRMDKMLEKPEEMMNELKEF